MYRRHFLRTGSLAAASTLLLAPAAFARILVSPAPVVRPVLDLTPYGGQEIQDVLVTFATAIPTTTYRNHVVKTDPDSLPLIKWQVPVADTTAYLEAGRWLMLGHFGAVIAHGNTLSFVYSDAQHDVTLVCPATI